MKILLIDGSGLIFRAFYALPKLKNSQGILTNGVYGFLTMYFNAIEKYKPDYVLVAFDKKSKTFRHKEFKEYKATRQKAPNELLQQFSILEEILDSLNIKHLGIEGFEADDIVGTYTRIAKENNIEAICITGDKDYLQLVNDNTSVFLMKTGVTNMKEYNLDTIKEEYEIEPEQLIDVKGLMGDKSDNIPGIEGIGEKTALKYIKKYGNLENLFDHLDEIKGEKAKEKLINGQTIAFMSRKIGTIVKNAPVNFEIEDLKLTSPNWSEVESEFEKYNFTKFLEKMPKEHKEGKNKSLDEFEYEFSDDCEKYSSNLLQNSKAFTFKGIYDGENYIKSKLIFIAIKPIGEKTTIFKYNNQFVKHFKKVFESNLKKYSFDIKEEKVLFKKDGIEIFSPFDDIMLMEYLYDPTKSGYEIKESAKTFLNFEILSKDDVLGKGKNKLNFNDVKKDKLGSYLSSNLNVIEKLYDILYKKLKEFNMVFLYEDIEKKLIDVLSSMEINGFETKKEVLEEIKGEVSKKIDNLTEEIYSLSNEEFNINSTKQLGKVLFDDLKLPVIKKTKTGYSTDAKVLSALRGKHPIIEKIEDYRELYKLKSTYLESLEEEIEDDNRIRSTFNQTVTSTGRISSKDPNLQNLPIKTERGRLIRKAFVAKKGYKLIDADYSQIELRLLAHLSKDENMINAFLNGDDIHKKTASEVFHVKLDDVTKSQRSKAKAVNFGIVYGISSFGLSQNLNISRKEASDYIEGYKNSYPGVKKYMQEVVKFAKDNGYTETLYHRRRYIPEINSRNFNMRNFGERIALNTPIQGTAADIIKIAMVNVYKKLKEENVDGNLILQIHDEIILEVKESDVEVAAKILKKEMENAAKLMVPLIADVNIGENLYESK